MFGCFSPNVDTIVPSHLAVIPDASWLKTPGHLLTTSQWCLDKGIGELSFFAWPLDFWETQDIIKLATFLKTLKSKQDISFQLVSSSKYRLSPELKQKMNQLTVPNASLKVYLYISYSFKEDLESVEHADQFKQFSKVPSSATDPDLLICTGGLYNLSNFCMAHLTKTTMLFSSISFDICDNEVWDDLIDTYTTIKTSTL
jgi:undecaprenyl pyrophosphate synthase|tara:strand:+ start:1521 stop:2120 length:600 start_codon:yes stop_codon:yes gene_type:complete